MKSLIESVMNYEISDETITDIFERIDSILKIRKNKTIGFIIGGPPCQAFSISRLSTLEKMFN